MTASIWCHVRCASTLTPLVAPGKSVDSEAEGQIAGMAELLFRMEIKGQDRGLEMREADKENKANR